MPESMHAWLRGDDAALFTDLYQLTMMQAYFKTGMQDTAAFSLFFRRLPMHRNHVLAVGLDTVLEYIERLHFSDAALAYLASLERFTPDFIEHLATLRFTGDIYAVAEGTPLLPNEPLLEVVAPIGQAQWVETLIMNQMLLQSALATKAARIVHAAAGKPVVDFALRRMHGIDAGVQGARAFHIAGVSATSNVLAGRRYGIPVSGTVAHSFIQACPDELEAFRRCSDVYPNTTLLVDTWDTLAGVDNVIRLARELGGDFAVAAIRLDSGDLLALSRQARARLDAAGLEQVRIVVSGGLDEYRIERLLAEAAPIDGFGVGSEMGVSLDAPSIDLAYKLVSYAGTPRMKLSASKVSLPARKQVFRGEAGDVIAAVDEIHPGTPLLQPVMRAGKRVDPAPRNLDELRRQCRQACARLPATLFELTPCQDWPVTLSPKLQALQGQLTEQYRGKGGVTGT